MNFLKVKSAENGYCLESFLDGKLHQLFVFEHDDTDQKQAEAFQALLYQIKEFYGPSDSRYSSHRVMIKIEPGDKFEDEL